MAPQLSLHPKPDLYTPDLSRHCSTMPQRGIGFASEMCDLDVLPLTIESQCLALLSTTPH